MNLQKPDVKVDSLKKRYFVKLLANLIGFVISLITQSIIPRSLGPKSYGDFSYLTNISTQIVGFFDMGTSLGFYTKISQRQKEFGLVSFYLIFSFVVSAVILLLVVFSQITSSNLMLWPDQSIFFVYLAAILAIVTWYLQIINNLGDAYGLTVPIEKMRIIQKFIGLVLILALFFCKKLDLISLFYYNISIIIFLIVAMIWLFDKGGYSLNQNWFLSKQDINFYIKEFYQYSKPLFIYSLVALIVGILDRWLLQIFSGSVQQGFYGLSFQIGAVCFLFTSSIASLIIREFSIAYQNKDHIRVAHLFRRYIPLFYGIASFFSCFIAIQAESVAFMFGGAKFHDAALAIAVMSFYQIHQTYGMLSGAVFLSTNRTLLYSKICIITSFIGLPISYFFIAPESKMGLNAGAAGLAIKMVIVQCLCVNVHLYFNCRFLKLNFWRYIGHQLFSVLFFLLFSVIATFIVNRVIIITHNVTVNFLLSGIIYTSMILVLIYFMPLLIGLNGMDMTSMKLLVLNKIWRKVGG
jgi:O-antigen/teichoic acid export membrane protein